MKNRFQIRKLEFIGDKENSFVNFFDGLNVVYGPSNTGKSLILESIQYVFGKEKANFEQIAELKKYNTIKVTIEDMKGNIFLLERSIFDEADDIIVTKKDDIFPIKYRPEHPTKNKKAISNFLLELTDADGMVIKTKQAGKKCNFTFNKEMLISMISEERIISKENPPFLTGQRVNRIEEASAFKLLMTDSDDSECIEIDDAKTYKNKLKAKLEMLIDIRKDIYKELGDISKELEKDDYNNINNRVDNMNNVIASKTEELSRYLEDRKKLIDLNSNLKSKKLFSEELLIRFDMHKKNLQSDFDRLNFVVESEHYLDQLLNKNCPICNSIIDENNIEYLYDNEHIDITSIKEAYEEEVLKINIQLRDIEDSIKYHQNLISDCISEIDSNNDKISYINNHLEREFYPELKLLESEMDKLNKIKKLQTLIEEKKLRIDKINIEYRSIEEKINRKAPENQYNKMIPDDVLKEYTGIIETTLEDWKYEREINAFFDVNNLDISINDKPRGSNGKGYRALIASVMMISLMKYLIKNDKIHPGFVILDSPLLNIKEEKTAKEEEKVSEVIQQSFYDSLSKYKNIQIIVIENKEPTEFAKTNANVIEFTKSRDYGRYGLL